MKVNLTVKNKPLKNYYNLSPIERSEPEFTLCDLNQIDKYLDDGECDQVYLNDILDYTGQSFNTFLQKLTRKVRLGGSLIVDGVDTEMICRKFLYDNDLRSFHEQVVGKTTHVAGAIAHILSLLNMKIVKNRLVDNRYIIEARREK